MQPIVALYVRSVVDIEVEKMTFPRRVSCGAPSVECNDWLSQAPRESSCAGFVRKWCVYYSSKYEKCLLLSCPFLFLPELLPFDFRRELAWLVLRYVCPELQEKDKAFWLFCDRNETTTTLFPAASLDTAFSRKTARTVLTLSGFLLMTYSYF